MREHLRVPHQVPRLERHRLQLPGRPVRPDLGGPVRRRRPPGGRCAHPRLQRQRVRDVGDRQLRDCAGRPRRCSRRTARCSPGSCRCTGSTPPRRRQWVTKRNFKAINGHRDAGLHGVPGQVPLRQDPADPRARLAAAEGMERPAARVRPRGLRPPRPHRAAQERRDGVRAPDPALRVVVQDREADPDRVRHEEHRGLPQRRRLGPRREQRPDLPQRRPTVRCT